MSGWCKNKPESKPFSLEDWLQFISDLDDAPFDDERKRPVYIVSASEYRKLMKKKEECW